jgi:hypothetical protein
MSPAAISKVEAPEILAISRGSFGQFLSIFALFCQFGGFSGTDFPFFDVFPISKHGILAPKMVA